MATNVHVISYKRRQCRISRFCIVRLHKSFTTSVKIRLKPTILPVVVAVVGELVCGLTGTGITTIVVSFPDDGVISNVPTNLRSCPATVTTLALSSTICCTDVARPSMSSLLNQTSVITISGFVLKL